MGWPIVAQMGGLFGVMSSRPAPKPAPMRYTSPGHRARYASAPSEAAQAFAETEARRLYGRRGYARPVEPAARPKEGETFRFRVWIGKPARGGGVGRVVTVKVTPEARA